MNDAIRDGVAMTITATHVHLAIPEGYWRRRSAPSLSEDIEYLLSVVRRHLTEKVTTSMSEGA